MPEFAKFLHNAQNLYTKLTQRFMSRQSCISFFSTFVPNSGALDDASTISKIAYSLEETNDKYLQSYIEKIPKCSIVNQSEFEEFKTKVLIGIYLIKWSQYKSPVTYYLNKPLVELFQLDLGIQSPIEMDDMMVDASLHALSQYCSFIYENQHQPIYADLNQQLGATIQVVIHTVRNLKFTEDSSWYGVCTEVMRTLGMNTVS